MKGYSDLVVFPDWAKAAFRMATAIVESVEDLGDPRGGGPCVRCHELARVVLPFLEEGWRVVDGKFGIVDHSWLVRTERSGDFGWSYVLDVYSVARLPMVQLVDPTRKCPLPFKARAPREDIDADVIARLDRQLRARGFCKPEETIDAR